MKTQNLKTIPFQLPIPNLDGDGVAEMVTINVQVQLDPETGEEVLTPESVELIEKTQARHMGLLSPEEIKELRVRLDLTQEEMSRLLQLGAKSYTRWESGRARPSRSLNILLCALRDGVITTEYLRCLHDGRDWEPLLNRRLAKSILLYQCDQTQSKISPARWPHHTGIWDSLLGYVHSQPEPALQDVAVRRPRKPPQVCRVPRSWEETATAA
jgi:DNA-binding transcriptional regulator YiaG